MASVPILRIAALALVANVAANIALVPSQGMVGAAIATVITELVVTAGCLFALRRLRAKRRRDSPQAMLSGRAA